jgi:hypothetical protein
LAIPISALSLIRAYLHDMNGRIETYYPDLPENAAVQAWIQV